MQTDLSKKHDIFLMLALKHADKVVAVGNKRGMQYAAEDFAKCLKSNEADKWRNQLLEHQERPDDLQQRWLKKVEDSIGSDELLLDANIHFSHIETALDKESWEVREILFASIPSELQIKLDRKKYLRSNIRSYRNKFGAKWIARRIRQRFIDQFVSRENLQNVNGFDLLNPTQIVRIVRLVGLREIALACVKIDAVESVTAFLRRFDDADARAVVTQIRSLDVTSIDRFGFAENIVQKALEIDEKPSAMINLLGVWLIGIMLSVENAKKVRYTIQRFPLEVGEMLSDVFNEQRWSQTPLKLQRQISLEVCELAEKLLTSEAIGN